MARLIDADALWEQISQHSPFDALALIEDAPTVDPVKHGHWIEVDTQYIDETKCSNCGVVEYFNKGWKRFNYCPHCGAKMDEVTE